MKRIAWIALVALIFGACTKGTNERYLILKFKFNDTLAPLNDTGGLYVMPNGNAAQTPVYNNIAANYVALSADSTFTNMALVYGTYLNDTTTNFVNYKNLVKVKDGEAFVSISLASIKPGTYNWLRVSIAYQNFDIKFRLDSNVASFSQNGVQYPGAIFNGDYIGTIAAFSAFSTFVDENGYIINEHKVPAYNQYIGNGVWALETHLGTGGIYYPSDYLNITGRANTTSVNPLWATRNSPTPKRSAVLTANLNSIQYDKYGVKPPAIAIAPLTITGAETESIIIECELLNKNSFEWQNGLGINVGWEPHKGEPIFDYGVRGMRPIIIK